VVTVAVPKSITIRKPVVQPASVPAAVCLVLVEIPIVVVLTATSKASGLNLLELTFETVCFPSMSSCFSKSFKVIRYRALGRK
jgi:hypothetical protein